MAAISRPLTLPPQTTSSDDPTIAGLLREAEREFGMIPNLYARMVNLPGLLATYRAAYAVIRRSDLTPLEQEALFLAISREHRCTYCVAAHSALADLQKMPPAILEALRGGAAIPAPKLGALVDFARVMVRSRGLPATADLDALFAAGYSEMTVLLVVEALAAKTISNYVNHLFDTPVDPPFASYAWEDPEAAVPAIEGVD